VRRGLVVLALAASASLFATGLVPAASAATASEKRVLRLIDSARQSHGLPPLRDSDSLCRSARRHSGYMVAHNYFGHLGRIRASRRFRRRGEALAMYSGWRMRPHRVLRLWLNSPPHRALVLSRGMRFAGVGGRRGRLRGRRSTVWTLHVGSY
jgi:uncharacterized protein YkwD